MPATSPAMDRVVPMTLLSTSPSRRLNLAAGPLATLSKAFPAVPARPEHLPWSEVARIELGQAAAP